MYFCSLYIIFLLYSLYIFFYIIFLYIEIYYNMNKYMRNNLYYIDNIIVANIFIGINKTHYRVLNKRL